MTIRIICSFFRGGNKIKTMSLNSTDCLECRLTSGGGLCIAGLYVAHCAQKFQGFNRYTLLTIGPGLGLLGILRIFDLPPFTHSKEPPQKTEDDAIGQDNYIIGKLPTKFR